MKITKENKGNKTTTTLTFNSKEDGIVNKYDIMTQAGMNTSGDSINPAEIGYGKGIIKQESIKFNKQPGKITKVLFTIIVFCFNNLNVCVTYYL